VVDEIRAASWSELQECLYEHSWNPTLRRYRSNLAFRGEPDAAYDLRSSLVRLVGEAADQLEGHLLRNFRKYAHRDAVPGDSVWNWLAVAAHHGLPTRLLDWTYSPYVSLHFATANLDLYHVDGVIWCVDYVQVAELLPPRLKTLLDDEGANVFTTEMLERGASTLQEFDRLAEEEFVIFLEPPSVDDRIVNQYALFATMSSPTGVLDHWLAAHDGLSRRIVVPAELKWEVRDKLDQANITERVLFPGLDGLSRWLKRHYTPNPG
jgi:hypothetical protein